jgi:hypothetical protein
VGRVYKGVCSVPGCGRTLKAKGLCATHYSRLAAHGDVSADAAVGTLRRWTQERADEVAARVGIRLLAPFKRIDVPVEYECLRCGTRGRQSVHVMRYSKVVCNPCARVAAGLNDRLPSAAVLESLADAEMELIGEYVGARIPVLVRCRVCGAESSVRLANVRNKGSRCRACADRDLSRLFRLSDADVAARAAVAGIELMEPFTATHERILVRCLNCGYESRRKLAWSKPPKGCVLPVARGRRSRAPHGP